MTRYPRPPASARSVRRCLVAAFVVTTMTAFGLPAAQAASDYAVAQPTVNGERTYLGLAGGTPTFTWALDSRRRGASQSAYQIVVGTSSASVARGQGDVWDSGKVASPRTAGVRMAAVPLASRTRYHYAIRSWDDRGAASAWSAPAWFETSIAQDEWTATWIARTVPEEVPARGVDPRTSQLRREFAVQDKPVRRARLYATALGVYGLRLNGAEVRDDRLAPGYTDYNHRVQVQTYDVTDRVRAGAANALAAELSTGWYAGNRGYGSKNGYGSPTPGLLAQLEITFADGSKQTVVTDTSWTTRQGPTVGADLQDGEHFDARLVQPGWDRPGFAGQGWEPVVRKEDLPAGAKNLVPQADQPVRPTQELSRVALTTSTAPGADPTASPLEAQIVDFGQNVAGVARLRVRDLPAGTTLRLRFGETLNKDGTLHVDNLRDALQTDTYVAGGAPVEQWTPQSTQHGFRYVEVVGHPGPLPQDALTAVVWGSDLPRTSSLRTSDRSINQLISNIEWSQRSNFLSIPTDCPQRSERQGWTGDINMFVGTAAIQMDVRRFLADKWLDDVRDAQLEDGRISVVVPQDSPWTSSGSQDVVWASAAINVPYTVWQATGELRSVSRNWDVMTKFFEHWVEAGPDTFFGDWAPPPLDPRIDSGSPASQYAHQHFKSAVALAWLQHDAVLMTTMAKALGQTELAARYAQVAEDLQAQFRADHVRDDGRVAFVGPAGLVEEQALYALALEFDLVPVELRAAASDRLAELIAANGGNLDTGFAGTHHLLPSLSEHGNLDAAYDLLQQRDYPSWLYQVDKGATTIWEYWNAVQPDGTMNDASLNHYAYGSLGQWMYETIGGIQAEPGAPGYERIVFRPQPGGGLTSASASVDSVRGAVRSSWTRSGDAFSYDVVVPVGATGTVHVPVARGQQVLEVASGRRLPAEKAPGVRRVAGTDGATTFQVGSGTYRFVTGSAGASSGAPQAGGPGTATTALPATGASAVLPAVGVALMGWLLVRRRRTQRGSR